MPLQTMSYWIALRPRIVSLSAGSSARNSSGRTSASRTGCGRSRSSSSSSFHSYIGKSTIQQNSKRSLLDQAELASPTLVRAEPGELDETSSARRRRRTPRRRRCQVAELCSAQCLDGSSRRRDCWRSARPTTACRPVGPPRRCSRARAGPRPAPRSSSGRRRRASRRPAPGSPTPPRSRCVLMPREDLEAGAAKIVGDVRHLDRIAQVRLVGAVLAHRLARTECAGTAASPACRRRTPRTRRAAPARPRRTRPPG